MRNPGTHTQPTPDGLDEWAQLSGPANLAGSKRIIQSIEHAFGLLEIFAERDAELPPNEIAVRAGLNASDCHHLLAAR